MNMPRVVCPTTEWILTNDPLRSYPKKGYQEPGFPYVLTKPTLVIQTVAQMTGITLLSYGCPAFKYISLVTPYHLNHEHPRSLAIASSEYPIIAVSSVSIIVV